MINKVKGFLWQLKERALIRVHKSRKINNELQKLNSMYDKFKENTKQNSLFNNSKKIILNDVYKPAFEFYWNYENSKTSENEFITEKIQKIKPSALNIYQWLALYRFFSLGGYFYIANQYREKAISLTLILKNNIFSPMRLFLKFTLFLELGDLKSAEKVLKMMKISPFRLLLSINSFDRLLSIYLEKDIASKHARSDKNFEKLIKDKTIAVVGPAPSKINNNDEIDSTDYVVRLNYHGQEYVPSDNKGTKVNFSYYNGEFSKKIFLDTNSVNNKLDYYNFKSNYKPIIHKYPNFNNSRKIEYFRVEFDGSFNMIQLTILDLLKFKPKLIKLYGTNFFLTKKTHSDSYIYDFTERAFFTKCKSFTVHNPILQFKTVKNLRNFGLIEVNEELNTILDMDEMLYLKNIDDLHGIKAH